MAAPERTILIIAYDGIANPATRLRALQYVPGLEAAGYRVRTVIYPMNDFRLRSVRLGELWREARAADVVFVQRVLAGWLNRLLRAAGTPVVFDVDDALQFIRQSQFARASSPRSPGDRAVNLYRQLFRGGRFHSARKRPLDGMLRLARAVIAGNRVLGDEFVRHNPHVTVLPTAVPVETFPVRRHVAVAPVRIGWIGVSSNVYHLEMLRTVFENLRRRFDDRVRLVVVSNRPFEGAAIDTEFVKWSLETESDEVARFDIGLMPLQDDLFSRGKCSFKAIYCMAHGVPVVLSPVGMNAELVTTGVDGYLADTVEEWTGALTALVADHELRARIGAEARRTIEREYGTTGVFEGLLEVVEGTMGRRD